MAPISEKRPKSQSQAQPQSHQSLIKELGQVYAHTQLHSHSGNAQNKESKERSTKSGLEILDFHESWLEEMAYYKDRLYLNKNKTNQPAEISDTVNPLGYTRIHTASARSVSPTKNAIANADVTGDTVKRRSPDAPKSRIVVRNAITNIATAPSPLANIKFSNAIESKQKANTQLLTKQLPLKRSRDEHFTSKTIKRQSLQTKVNPPANTMPTAINGQNHTKSANQPTPTNNSSASKSGTKVTVNQFHASSLLSTQQQEEKAKILTQNGVPKSAATALENSQYAAHYLQRDARAGFNSLNGVRQPSPDYTNFVGVSLAKTGDREARISSLSPFEDPCSAIDDLSNYGETDSDDEYVGDPFYLAGDNNDTYQSHHIHYKSQEVVREEAGEEEQKKAKYYKPDCILSPSLFPNVPPYLNFSSHCDKGPSMPMALHKVLKWKLSPVMPKIVKRVVLNSGFRIIRNTTDWMAIWEKHMKSPGFRTIRSHQKYNHMPGSFRIGRKDSIWRSIDANVRKFGSKEFGFMQKSYILPDDLESLRQCWPKNASKLTKWIVKPPASARGTGIRIINKWSQFPKDRPLVVQKYIERPLLINDNKFDMRIYVFITSINPLRIYMHKDGLARFASVKYSSELNCLDDRCMHLTNYSINKYSQNYSKNEDYNACQGHKWTLQSLWSCLEGRGVNTKRLWATLRNLVIKAVISGESGLNRMYRQNVNFRYNCFELFGFDILLDENLIPWLLEINISPSLHSELPLDLHVKGPLIQAVLNTALYQVPPKLNEITQQAILQELQLTGPLCHDKRIFTTILTAEEVRKHNFFTNRSMELREEYIDSILDNLQPDDVRCLIISEDELARSQPLERIFPSPDTHNYLKFVDSPRYYNRLLDAWEYRYGKNREEGIALLRKLCEEGYHLLVSNAAMEKEPDVMLTEIDMLHTKKSDIDVSTTNDATRIGDSVPNSKDTTPESNMDSMASMNTLKNSK